MFAAYRIACLAMRRTSAPAAVDTRSRRNLHRYWFHNAVRSQTSVNAEPRRHIACYADIEKERNNRAVPRFKQCPYATSCW